MVDDLREEYGAGPYARRDLPLTGEEPARVAERISGAPPSAIGGRAVTEIDRIDGLRLTLDDTAWLLARPSGTEPLVRLYCEAAPGGDPGELLDAAQAWLTGP